MRIGDGFGSSVRASIGAARLAGGNGAGNGAGAGRAASLLIALAAALWGAPALAQSAQAVVSNIGQTQTAYTAIAPSLRACPEIYSRRPR